MAYSTVAQLRINIPELTSGIISDSSVENYISKADTDVDLWLLENGVELADIPATPDTPSVVNLMSQYGTCVYALLSKYSHMETIPADLAIWQEKRDKLFSGRYEIKVNGDALFTPSVASVDNTYSDDFYFGTDRYGRNI